MIEIYEEDKKTNKNHVATPRWVVENIYNLIYIEKYKSIWFPFNHYDSEFKLKADELKLRYKATHIFNDLHEDFFTTEPPARLRLTYQQSTFSDNKTK